MLTPPLSTKQTRFIPNISVRWSLKNLIGPPLPDLGRVIACSSTTRGRVGYNRLGFGGEDGGMEGGGVLSSGLEWWERYTGHAGTSTISTWEETRNKTNSVQNIWH